MPPRAPANANGHQSAGLTLRCLEQFRKHTADQVRRWATGGLVGDVSRSARVRQLSSQKEKSAAEDKQRTPPHLGTSEPVIVIVISGSSGLDRDPPQAGPVWPVQVKPRHRMIPRSSVG